MSAIKKAYMKKALLLHPDKCGNNTSEAAFKMIAQAWEVLSEHHLSPSDVQADVHGVGDAGGHSTDEVQALMRERDNLKRTVEHQADTISQHAAEREVQDMRFERLSNQQYYLNRALERETDANIEQYSQLQQEKTAYEALSREWQSLQRTVQQQDTKNYNQGFVLLQQSAEVRALTAKIASQARTCEERICELKNQAEIEVHALENQLDYYLCILSLVIFVFALGAAGSWFLDGEFDVDV